MAAMTTTSTSCSNFWQTLKPNSSSSSVRSTSSNRRRIDVVSHPPQSGGCNGSRIDGGVGMWLINGLTSAFFASLERCSCVRVSTVEDVVDNDVNELPLIYNDGNSLPEAVDATATAAVRSRRFTGGTKGGGRSGN